MALGFYAELRIWDQPIFKNGMKSDGFDLFSEDLDPEFAALIIREQCDEFHPAGASDADQAAPPGRYMPTTSATAPEGDQMPNTFIAASTNPSIPLPNNAPLPGVDGISS